MRLIVMLSMLLGISAGIAAADLDLPCVSTTLDVSQRLLLIPDNDGSDPSVFGAFTVTIKNNQCVPIEHAAVEILIAGGEKTRLCGDAVNVQYTDAAGVATFNIPGGGCVKGRDAILIRANGVTVRSFESVVSPDYAGWDNTGVPNRWSLSVSVVDFAAFATAVHNGGSSCHDYDNNGTTGATDMSVFGQIWSGGSRMCAP
jgi:hypothetical protein